MNDLFEKLRDQFMEIWGKLSKTQKIAIGAVAGLFFVFLIVFSSLSSKVDYAPLFTGLEDKDASVIKAQLDKKGVKYKIKTGENGTIIQVDIKERDMVRLDLAKDGALPKGGNVGLEIFDSAKFTATEFDKQIMFLRAQKGELERTISSLKQVKTARVDITPEGDSPFAEERTPAKASILVEMQPIEKLSEENIKSIILLAVSSIKGLSPENVEVIDNEGNLLSERVEFEESGSAITNKKMSMQAEMEKKLESKAMAQLGALGGGNARVKIAIDLDFDKEVADKESYTTPTVSGEQLQQGLVRSVQTNNESYKGSGNVAEGVPGTSSNIPGYVGINGNGQGKEYNKNNSTINYEMDATKVRYEKALGKIRKLNISVILNEKADYFKERKFNDAERIKFENVVKTAVSFDDKRGDTINVTAFPFDMKNVEKFSKEIQKQEKNRTYLIIGVVVFLVLSLVVVGIIILMSKLEEKKLRERERKAVEELIPEMEDISLGAQVSVEEQERKEKEDQIKELVKQKPDIVAGLIRAWMTED